MPPRIDDVGADVARPVEPAAGPAPKSGPAFRPETWSAVGQKRVCLITTTHLSSNPRAVKEADALAGVGCRVTIISAQWIAAQSEIDRRLARGRPWDLRVVDLAERDASWVRHKSRWRHFLCRMMPRFTWPAGVAERAVCRVTPELTAAARATPADLYIAHNLGALPAAFKAARKHRAKLGFDAEDFHSGELPYADGDMKSRRLASWVEGKYLDRCDYVTAASPAIARVYAESCGIPTPTTVLNVFPLCEAPPHPVAASARPGPSLYWFSQTIGPDRGLEDAVRALGAMRRKAHLHLRGTPAVGYRSELDRLAVQSGAADRIHWLPPEPPDQMVRLAARHDVGLALEQPVSRNREICVTNKLFTYLLAGVPAAASATPGQREVCAGLSGAAELYDPGEWRQLAALLDRMLENPAALAERRRTAWRLAQDRFNWDREKRIFLDAVGSAMATPLESS